MDARLQDAVTQSCNRCGEVKPLEDFHRDRRTDTGRVPTCRACVSAYGKAYYIANRDYIIKRASDRYHNCRPEPRPRRPAMPKARVKRREQLRRYGLTEEQYTQMFQSASGVCEVCQLPQPNGRLLCIDHNHSTGEVRGLLCVKCNTALGMAGDDPERLRALADYLENRDE